MAVQFNVDNKRHTKKSEKDVPAKPGVQRFSAFIWLADGVQHETKVVSTSLVWSHALGLRVNEAIYFMKVGDKYVYLQPYVPICETLKKNKTSKVSIRGFRPDDPTLPHIAVEEKTGQGRQRYTDLEADDIDANTLSPTKVTLNIEHPCNDIEHSWDSWQLEQNEFLTYIEHPCNDIEHSWDSWQLEQNEFLTYIAKLVCKRKVYGEQESVALNVCIDGVRMQIEGKADKTMRESGFQPPVQAWVYREEKATLETAIMNEVSSALREAEDMDTSSEDNHSTEGSDLEERNLSLKKSKDKPLPPAKTTPKPKPQPTPHPIPQPKNHELRLYLRLPTEEKVMEVVTRSTTIKQIKSMLCAQEDLDPRAKITISFEKAKLPDEITVQGAQLENNAILDVSYN